MSKEIFISVIIPVYNAESYLVRCIESILSQEYNNFEIILINDGSTDDSKNICERYIKLYKNIKVTHQINQGVSIARNKGIDIAKGEYICFIDADDYILPNYFKTINKLYHGCDILRFESTSNKYYTKSYNNKDFITNKHYSSTVWLYAFNRNLINEHNIEFPIGITHSEDFSFVTKIISVSTNIKDVNLRFYKYQYNPKSAIHRKLTHKAADSHIFAIIDIITFLKKKNINEPSIFAKIIQDYTFYFFLLAKIPYKDYSYKHAKLIFNNFKKDISTIDKELFNTFIFKIKLPFFFHYIYAIIKHITKMY